MWFQAKTQLKNWSDRDVEGVCSLLASLKGVTPSVLPSYAKNVRDNNISGLVLQNCDLEELRPVLQMRFGDWQLFRAAILSLREWDGYLVSPDPTATPPANNSATVAVSSLMSPRTKDNVPTAGREGAAKFQQGRGPAAKGVRMRRNDSIVQQLSYEAAILHEALEEFPEDSDKDVVDTDDLSLQGAAGHTSGSEGTPGPTSEDQPPISTASDADDTSIRLSSLITVLDSPREVGGDEGRQLSESADSQFSPFVLQSSFPSGAQLPLSFGVEEATDLDRNESHVDSLNQRQHFLHSLSTGLEKIARPIIHALGHSHDQHHHHFGEEEGEITADRIALMTMPLGGTHPVENPQASGVTSPWDHSVFTPIRHPPTQVNQTEVTLETPPGSRPAFTLGSGHSSPTHPTFTVESETSDSVCTESSGVRSPGLSGEEAGPWVPQLHVHAAAPSPTQHTSQASQLEEGGGEAEDNESFV